ncbi:hypothetical protein JYU19_01085 [bacterium AH-315-J21]|nr:hypothetical protein [bacterium AH-315-J21]
MKVTALFLGYGFAVGVEVSLVLEAVSGDIQGRPDCEMKRESAAVITMGTGD